MPLRDTIPEGSQATRHHAVPRRTAAASISRVSRRRFRRKVGLSPRAYRLRFEFFRKTLANACEHRESG